MPSAKWSSRRCGSPRTIPTASWSGVSTSWPTCRTPTAGRSWARRSCRLSQPLRGRARLVLAIESGYGAWEKAGVATVTARLDPANLDRAEASILEVLRRVRAEGVSEAERQRAIVTAESNYAFDIETAEGLAKTYGQAETTWTLPHELVYLPRL